MSTPLRIGILGFGRVATNHLKRLQTNSALFDVVAVCDRVPERREAAKAAGVPHTDDDITAFLQRDLEVVFITTHSAAHYEPALACIAAGKHVVIEKPVTVHASEAEEIFRKADERGVVALVHHNRRFDADYQHVRRIIEERGVGDLVLVENRVGSASPAIRFATPDFDQQWRIKKAMGGGTLMDFGPHYVDQVLDLVPGEIVGVLGDVRCVHWGDADDYFHITLLYGSGTRAVVSKADFVYHMNPKWLVYGSEATVWRDADGVTHWKNAEAEASIPAEEPGGRRELHPNYYEVFREGKEPLITPKAALRVARVLDAARESAAAGKLLDVRI